ncbi:MAG TPA: glycosyltransferase family 9 protein [Phycisphaerales bacterium]|nr:glycosyltransferase family 9 protein [Phycisphaerales bacterium]
MSPTSPPQRILIIRPSALGDVCRTVPVLASLRQAFPEAEIDWVVQDDFAPAISAHPALSSVVAFPRHRFATWWHNPFAAWELVQWLTKLRRTHYDIAIDCQGLGRSGLIAKVTGASRRVGHRAARELGWLGYNIRHPGPDRIRGNRNADAKPVHTVDSMLSLLACLHIPIVPDMALYLKQEDADSWVDLRGELGLGGSKYAVLAPTSRWLSKRWPIERFAELLEPLHERGFDAAVVVGSASELAQVQPLLDAQPPHGMQLVNLVGQTTLAGSMAVIASASLVIANDSAPLHIAVGFDRPCVALFGPTDPAIVGPYNRPESVVRKYAPREGEEINFKSSRLRDSLMRLIETSDVVERIDDEMTRSAEKKESPMGHALP